MSYSAEQAREDSGVNSVVGELNRWHEAIDAIKAAAAQGNFRAEIEPASERTAERLENLGYSLCSYIQYTEVRWA